MEIREGDTSEVFEEDGEVGGVRRTKDIFCNSLCMSQNEAIIEAFDVATSISWKK